MNEYVVNLMLRATCGFQLLWGLKRDRNATQHSTTVYRHRPDLQIFIPNLTTMVVVVFGNHSMLWISGSSQEATLGASPFNPVGG